MGKKPQRKFYIATPAKGAGSVRRAAFAKARELGLIGSGHAISDDKAAIEATAKKCAAATGIEWRVDECGFVGISA